jgi:selenocysteine lyase/cysteine desulfurase
MLFSAPTYKTGTMLSMGLLAELAQQHGLTTVVDAAHVPGMMNYRFRELGVDFLAGSTAKWHCGPGGTGVLYARNKVLPQFNPVIGSVKPHVPVRISTHLFHREEHVERVVDAMWELSAAMA